MGMDFIFLIILEVYEAEFTAAEKDTGFERNKIPSSVWKKAKG